MSNIKSSSKRIPVALPPDVAREQGKMPLATLRPGLIVWSDALDDSAGVILRYQSDACVVVQDFDGNIYSQSDNDVVVPAAGSVLDRIADGIAKLLAADKEVGGLIAS